MEVVEWRESKKGNQWAKINGKVCTVFTTDEGNYKGIACGDDGEKEYTECAYDDEDECKDALEELANG